LVSAVLLPEHNLPQWWAAWREWRERRIASRERLDRILRPRAWVGK
jgi:hypothetical protein